MSSTETKARAILVEVMTQAMHEQDSKPYPTGLANKCVLALTDAGLLNEAETADSEKPA